MTCKLKVGDVVRLNDEGMSSVLGVTSMEMFKQSQRMIITEVGGNITNPEFTYPIVVDQPLINRFLITDHDVELL